MRLPDVVRGGLATAAAGLLAAACGAAPAHDIASAGNQRAGRAGALGAAATSPVKHLVVIFQENVSFDHYFGTYPVAAGTDGTPFRAKAGTPTVNGLTADLLRRNPNKNDPARLGPAQAVTCDQDHRYGDEQRAFDAGKMDRFVEFTGVESCKPPMYTAPGLVMDYFDGNTVTAMWNYAQRFAMSDAFFGTTFGPSTPGALNLVSGQTHGGVARDAAGAAVDDPRAIQHPDAQHVGTVNTDPEPFLDDCSDHTRNTVQMTGRNIGDLLTAGQVSWGWFQGGFRTADRKPDGSAACRAAHANVAGIKSVDYVAHHEPFQYYKSTANPHHVPPASVAEIGHAGRANHQYDVKDWYQALAGGTLPAVSFLKAPGYQDGHAGYSDPLDEQRFVVDAVNRVQASKFWASTAVVIAYDDSDGWYDHQASKIVNPSADPVHDALDGPGVCGSGTPARGYQDRCGYGPRLPLLVLSPYARANHVDHTVTDQTSILRFIEDNWLSGRRIGDGSFDSRAGSLRGLFDFTHPKTARLVLDPKTGRPAA